MFVPEIFEMLQDSFHQHHSKFNFPNKQVEDSSPKFQAAIGEFTIRLNQKIRNDLAEKVSSLEEGYNRNLSNIILKYKKDIQGLKWNLVILSFVLGLSIAINIALIVA